MRWRSDVQERAVAYAQNIDNAVTAENQKTVSADLLPTQKRIMGKTSYLCMWLSGCVVIGTFTAGSSVFGVLNLKQSIAAMVIGCVLIALTLVVNGRAGHTYGIPMTIQLRTSFGTAGSKVAGLIRAVPAVVWFGFQSWVGGGALNLVLNTLFGFDHLVFCFVVFHVLQVVLAAKGFHGIKWLENIGAVFILVTLIYMGYTTITKYGTVISDSVIHIQGTWGLGFWAGVTVFLGLYTGIILNVSDLSRNFTKSAGDLTRGIIYLCAILPCTLMMCLIGLIVAAATGVYDPITIFSSTVDNPILLIATMLFIIFSQVTTNVLNNMVPPIYVIMDLVKVSFPKAAIITAIVAVCTCPWLLVTDESAAGLALFIQIYSAFLGPIFAVMAVDYYIIRKRKLLVNELYNPKGAFAGVNWAGIIAIAIGALFAVLVVEIGWFISLVPAGLAYYLLMTKTTLGKRFCVGTKYEAKAAGEGGNAHE